MSRQLKEDFDRPCKKTINELSKNELKNLFMNKYPYIDFTKPIFECAVHGITDSSEFYYICDQCEEGI